MKESAALTGLAEPSAPAVAPALTVDQRALTVEPVAPATVEPPAAEKPVATTVKRVTTKKTAKKPAEKPATEVSESLKVAAPVASAAAVDVPANPPPSDAAANAVAPKSIAPPPAAAKAPAAENLPVETKTTMGIGGWLLAGIVVAALFGGITLIRRRKTRSRTSIVEGANLTLDLEPVPVPRP